MKDHLKDVYGEDCVAGIGTFSISKSKGIFKDVARIYGLPFQTSNEISKLFPDLCESIQEAIDSSKDIQQFIKQNEEIKEVFKYAEHLEGTVRNIGVHASGIAITPTAITDIVPLYSDKEGQAFTMFDHHALEDIGIIKFDVLGLKTLSIIGKALELIEFRTGKSLDLDTIPKDDQAAYDLISDNNTVGVFQIGGSEGLRNFAAEAKPKNISDISNVISLYRPGPLGMGADKEYIARCKGDNNSEFEIPEFNYIFKDNEGLLIYQENLMLLAKDMCGFNDVEADTLRRATAKKDTVLLESLKQKFIDGAVKYSNQNRDVISKLFDSMSEFARYSFNKCLVGETKIRCGEYNDTYSIEFIKFLLLTGCTVIIESYDTKTGKRFPDECLEVIDTGMQECVEIEFENGHKETCSLDHKFLCFDNKMHTVKEIIELQLDVLNLN